MGARTRVSTLKEAVNEAMRYDWVTNIRGTHLSFGTAAGIRIR